MPRITKNGPVRFMATKLYLITSTVATGVGGGFLFPDASPWRYPATIAPLSSKTAKLFLRLPYGGVATPPQCCYQR